MELIHADHNLIEKQSLTDLYQWDLVAGLSNEYEDNDFELSIPIKIWDECKIEKGHFLYEPGAEWGGRVELIHHIDNMIKLGGPTWRGLLARKNNQTTTWTGIQSYKSSRCQYSYWISYRGIVWRTN